ncbi:MAG: hypothetical protein M1818_006356 [Claussenomyces sp. TS43310]|nr:MAG: hypothetical protein M1818_006356 [Claussenomyces sp. TS43310]
MPSYFDFQQGNESRSTPTHEAAPLLGRFRAVPGQRRGRGDSVGKLISTGYGSIFGILGRTVSFGEDGDEDDLDGDEETTVSTWTAAKRMVIDLWITPQQGAVRKCCDRWWSRWTVLVVLPAAIAVAWCALPFPQYPLPDDYGRDGLMGRGDVGRAPGHGAARVQVNFWFFLFVYYGFYNIIALMWMTKVFNIYSLNWWPESIGFPVTVSIIMAVSVLVPIPTYFVPELRRYLSRNTTWIFWTFITMAMPVMVAFTILMSHERHLGLRQSLSETQRIFTSSWWTNESDESTIVRRERRRAPFNSASFDPDAGLDDVPDMHVRPPVREAVRLRKLWIPASFMRFVWFCLALSIGLIAYVLGETYAEIYLRTLPHSNIETIVYVYSWVATIHLLDGLTGWILGGEEGERVGSYPLGWIFKLYFSLTYQTYVRALYARLRSPQTFIILQIISSTGLILFHPLAMSSIFHSALSILGLNNQPYPLYQKYAGRSIFIRSLSENVSMLSFLGQVAVLHFGHNRRVYPYFAFDDKSSPPPSAMLAPTSGLPWDGAGRIYDFRLTFWASSVTWVSELTAAWIVRRVINRVYGFNVNLEGVGDLGAWPELLPTSLAVMVHVLQNMIFGIVRLEFH